jgi:hypothetical protein
MLYPAVSQPPPHHHPREEKTHILTNQRHPVDQPRVLHLVQESLHNHLPDAAPMQPRQHRQRVHTDGARALEMPDVLGRPPAPAAPVLGVRHVAVRDDVPAAPRRDDVREQHTHGAVNAARLDGLGGREGFNVEVLGMVWNDGEEDA